MTIEQVLSRLGRVRESGGGWSARCPAHDDVKNSLSITERGSKILLHCHAGCAPESILAKVGLKLSDLFLDSGNHNGLCIAATYDYRDEKRTLLYQVVRLEPKAFRARQPDGNGGWIWNLRGVRRVLYRLPELLASSPEEIIWIVEGEKDVESLRTLGLIATCNVGGAGKWRSEYNEYFRRRKIVIIPDNDEAGRKHAEDVANHLQGIAQ